MEPVNHCPHCGAAVDVNASVCPECGQELVKRKYCPHCGERIDADCIICPKCGKQAGELPQDKQINIVNNNNSSASASASASVGIRTAVHGKYCNKWTAFSCACSLGISVRINSMKDASAWVCCTCSPSVCWASAGLLISF